MTSWERRKALSDQLRGIWDAKREGCADGWRPAFDRAKAHLVVKLSTDISTISEMQFDDFLRLQGIRTEVHTA